ncbi:hypothetical protein PR048_011811 [Dryococelus australis]|uniref:Reverse transcriptase Ty1/copia-type domain-containing protein n=1 Tax=Dryococelus australis TaxID=614101 RepID=A0ABQ9HMP2_9NEOP|nr:hypothetical protein PR048_011811 [Dryococelus australis]
MEREGAILIVVVYVDDLLIFYDDHKLSEHIKDRLKDNFEMKDLYINKEMLRNGDIERLRKSKTLDFTEELRPRNSEEIQHGTVETSRLTFGSGFGPRGAEEGRRQREAEGNPLLGGDREYFISATDFSPR